MGNQETSSLKMLSVALWKKPDVVILELGLFFILIQFWPALFRVGVGVGECPMSICVSKQNKKKGRKVVYH